MLRTKPNIEQLYRPPLTRSNKSQYVALDKNEAPFSLHDITNVDELGDVTKDSRCYPDPYPLYEKLSVFLDISLSSLLLTTGSDQGIRLSFELMVQNGDEVVFMDPTFAMIDVLCAQYNGIARKICFDNNLRISDNDILDAINTNTKLVVIANPNNPTGTIIKSKRLEDFARKCDQVGALLLIDEAYFPYCSEANARFLLSSYENLVITRTFSKAWGLAGIRTGYMIAPPNVISYLRKIKPPFELTSHSISTALLALNHPSLVELNVSQVTQWKNRFKKVKRTGLTYIDTEANYIMFRLSDSLHNTMLDEFEKRKILVKTDMSSPCMKGIIRFSVTTDKIMDDILQFFSS